MRYVGTVIRPPSEARSYILQIAYGCSYNRCTFCPTYKDKPFAIRPTEEVMEDITLAGKFLPQTRRVFLADGNALVLGNDHLVPILDALAAVLPDLQRVGVYANSSDILNRSEETLKELIDHRLRIVYLGLESGSARVLRAVKKGATPDQLVEAVRKAEAVGLKTSVIVLLGLGGRKMSRDHAIATARAVSQMSPTYLSALTVMLAPGTVLYEQARAGKFELPEPPEILTELRTMLEHIEVTRPCVFRANHASNYLPLAGRLPNDWFRLISEIDQAIAAGPRALRPESLRAL